VPFFLPGGTARGRGRGDRIEPLAYVGEHPVVLGWPPFGIPTAEVFRRVAERLTAPEIGVSVPNLSALKWPEDKDFGLLANDLEAVVYEGWPELRGFRDALLETGAGAALLSGSGSAVFGVFSDGKAASRAAKILQSRFAEWCVLATRFVGEGIRSDAAPGGEA
jgi:4-diphosphocytidyl-2-C-methyl-D-erythritol kinase